MAEELEQELDPGFGSNKSFQHGRWARLRHLSHRLWKKEEEICRPPGL
jgi:hypothetical protein